MSRGVIDMAPATRRLETALRELAGGTDRKVSDVARAHKHEPADLWAWLGQFNRSNPKLSAHVIDGVLAGLTPRALAKDRPTASAKAIGQIVRRRGEAAAGTGSALAAPPPDLAPWLSALGLKPEPVTSWQVEITPGLAGQLLQFNTANRNPSRAKISRFADLIRAGRWTLNGETVKFGSDGRLLDGQSRLRAIVEAGQPAHLELRGGLSPEAQRTMDCGEVRKGTHTLEMLGEEHAQILSPALRLVFKWETGQLGTSGSGQGRGSLLENLAMPGLLDRHAGLRQSVAWAVGLGPRLRKWVPLSEASAFHYLFAMGGRLKRDAFFDGLVSGNALSQPVALYRQRVTAALPSRLSSHVLRRLLVKAWNAHHAGRQIEALTLAPREGVAAIAGAVSHTNAKK
jgi:hypothetical protein